MPRHRLPTSGGASSSSTHRAIHWFRKGLRLHDNPSFLEALRHTLHAGDSSRAHFFPVFVLDPWFVQSGRVGCRRMTFLWETLSDLDRRLREVCGLRLFVLRGNPLQVIPEACARWKCDLVTWEVDTEPYAQTRDAEMRRRLSEDSIEVRTCWSHTLYDLDRLVHLCGKGNVPTSYSSFLKVLERAGSPPSPSEEVPASYKHLPLASMTSEEEDSEANAFASLLGSSLYDVPTKEEIIVSSADLSELEAKPTPWIGGETQALERMQDRLSDIQWVAKFEKPSTSPTDFSPPSTTVLSPYLKFGCLSARTFFQNLLEVYRKARSHSQPPVSLLGQLYWREFFYLVSYGTPNFDRMEGNPICMQIPWNGSDEHFEAWKHARTGFPFIDAAMTQLREEGWMHHLARHAVACFLTRGDLFVHWERGRDVFDNLLLDADWALNNGNWMWLSASSFFYQFFRVYSPIAFPKKTDKSGNYVRRYLPILRKFPDKYIYEPWTAPLDIQKKAGCIIGVDYPQPIVDHAIASKWCIGEMQKAYKLKKKGDPGMTNIVSSIKIEDIGNPEFKENTSIDKSENTNATHSFAGSTESISNDISGNLLEERSISPKKKRVKREEKRITK